MKKSFNNYLNSSLLTVQAHLLINPNKNKSIVILIQYLPPSRLLAVTVLPALSSPRIASVTFLHASLQQ